MVEKILLDSTYLLPIVGIAVKDVEEILKVLERLYRADAIELYYTHFNILEIMGKLSRTWYEVETVKMGLRSIMENFRQASPTYQSYVKALQLKSIGFRDLIDLLLYTTSVDNGLQLLTRDRKLWEFVKKTGEGESKAIILEEEFLKTHR